MRLRYSDERRFGGGGGLDTVSGPSSTCDGKKVKENGEKKCSFGHRGR